MWTFRLVGTSALCPKRRKKRKKKPSHRKKRRRLTPRRRRRKRKKKKRRLIKRTRKSSRSGAASRFEFCYFRSRLLFGRGQRVNKVIHAVSSYGLTTSRPKPIHPKQTNPRLPAPARR